MLDHQVALPPRIADFLGAKAAPRTLVESIIEELVETLDAADGDTDLEEIDVEDSFVLSDIAHGFAADGPGCIASDPDCGVEDDFRGFDPEEDFGIDDVRHDGEGLDEPDDAISRAARRPHRDRIRRTRCDRIPTNWLTGAEYRLRDLDGRALARTAVKL